MQASSHESSNIYSWLTQLKEIKRNEKKQSLAYKVAIIVKLLKSRFMTKLMKLLRFFFHCSFLKLMKKLSSENIKVLKILCQINQETLNALIIIPSGNFYN